MPYFTLPCSRLLKSIFFSLSLLLMFSKQAEAKLFKTQFIKVDLPPNWDCKQEEQDWVCQPDNIAERSEALIVIVTKELNEVDDTYPKYNEVLNTPKDMRDLVGNPYKSTVRYVRERDIKGHKWVDSLQLGSEMPGFYTRYVAAIKEKIAALLTYSIGESVYPKWSQVMDQMVDSLEIQFDPAAFNELKNKSTMSLLASRRGMGGGRTGAQGPDDNDGKSKSRGFGATEMLGVGLVVGAIAYIVHKRRQG